MSALRRMAARTHSPETGSWVRAPTAAAAAKRANERIGPLGGWTTDIELEVFPRAEYPERAEPQDYTRSVIHR